VQRLAEVPGIGVIWEILQRIRYEERGPAVSTEAKTVCARKMIRELQSLGVPCRATLSSTRPSSLMGRDFRHWLIREAA
jgi:hypothetical protein